MKIKTAKKSYEEVMSLKKAGHIKPLRPKMFFRTLMKAVSDPELKQVGFSYKKRGMEGIDKEEPCLFLMNHSSSIDLKIAAHILYPRPFNIVCTSDGFVGKEWLMRQLGCIPTKKFVTDVGLIKDMMFATGKLKSSVLMYPEASYSFDGTATPLPDSLGKCIKMLKVPVVMIRTYGAFQRDPLYNNLQLRDVKVRAEEYLLLSKEDVEAKSAGEINEILKEAFSFDNFTWQKEENVKVEEPFRADYLNRALYKCPHCMTEGEMKGEGIHLTCKSCGADYEMTELGELKAVNLEGKFSHIPDWYRWERECVKQELESESYKMETEVDIYMMVDYKAVYQVGEGVLQHDMTGFHLSGCDGKLNYEQKPTANYSLYSDYYWYEIGDMICIGTYETLYYCFPKDGKDVVAKSRLAAEEMYKMAKKKK